MEIFGALRKETMGIEEKERFEKNLKGRKREVL